MNAQQATLGSWVNWSSVMPTDPGGPLTEDRIRILRSRAAGYSGFSTLACDSAMIDVLDALEEERQARLEAEQEAELLRRVVRDGLDWLVAEVDSGQAASIQADRALVLCTENLGCVPVVPCAPRRWWTSAEPPMDFDRARFAIACRVLRGLRP